MLLGAAGGAVSPSPAAAASPSPTPSPFVPSFEAAAVVGPDDDCGAAQIKVDDAADNAECLAPAATAVDDDVVAAADRADLADYWKGTFFDTGGFESHEDALFAGGGGHSPYHGHAHHAGPPLFPDSWRNPYQHQHQHQHTAGSYSAGGGFYDPTGGVYWSHPIGPATSSSAHPGPSGLPYPPPPGSSVLSRESSRDDLTSMCDSQIFEYEDRFRVDRRKLEMLMMGHFDPIRESAVEFFCRIGDETGTTVIWPSRLKIGAKSKKDPHIRVGGCEEGVRRAKGRIMEFLDTRSNRVTMKMDVSYTDHSHVIGKGGNTIRRVMAETNCHIHFPDSNRSNPNEKSNQVSIAGEIDGVETARARVRELTPLIFCFDLPIMSSLQCGAPDINDPYLRAIQDQYNIQVTFRQKQKNFHTTMVVVKGSECEAARVKEATLLLMEHLCGGATAAALAQQQQQQQMQHAGAEGPDYPQQTVSMNMEISPQHHPIVLGKGNLTLKLIMQRTNTTILFPDAADPNIPSIRKGSVVISGSIHNVYLARQQLIGSLPLVMMFDISDDSDLDESTVQRLQADLDVSISIKPKARQANKSVVVKAQERNASAIYRARAILLGLNAGHGGDGDDEEDDGCVRASIPETYNIQAVSATTGMTLPVNHRAFAAPPAQSSLHQHLNNQHLLGGGGGAAAGAPQFRPPFSYQMPPPPPATPSTSSSVASRTSSAVTPLMRPVVAPRPLVPPPAPATPQGGGGGYFARPPQQPQSAFSAPPPHPFAGLFNGNVAARNNNAHIGGGGWAFGGGVPPPVPPFSSSSYGGGVGGPGGVLPPNHPFLQDYAMLVLNNITRLQQQQHQEQQRQQQQQQHWRCQQGSAAVGGGAAEENNNNAGGGASSSLDSSLNRKDIILKMAAAAAAAVNAGGNGGNGGGSSNILTAGDSSSASSSRGRHLGSPPIPGTSPRNSSPVRDDGNLSNNLGAMNLNESGGGSVSGSAEKNSSGVFLSGGNSSSGASSSNNNNNNNSFYGDRRAPGCEKEMNSMLVKATNGLTDYDHKRLLASKAMRQRPGAGEVRTPTPHWSGLGFSSSMPESVIKEKMEASDGSILQQQESVIPEEDASVAGGGGDNSVSSSSAGSSSFQASSSGHDSGSSGGGGGLLSRRHPPPGLSDVGLNAPGGGQQQQQQLTPVLTPRTPHSAGISSEQRHRMLFGNSSAFDTLLSPKPPPTTASGGHASSSSSGGGGAPVDFCSITAEDDLPSVFARQGLAKYTDLFLRQEIDLRTFAALNEDDLREIGVQTFGARKKLMLLASKAKHALENNWKM